MKRLILIISIFLLAGHSYAQNWAKMTYVSSAVRTFYVDTVTDDLYIGGNFKLLDGDTMFGIARYNGAKFSRIGCGIEWDCITPIGNPSSAIYGAGSIIRYKKDIYATGAFIDPNYQFNGIVKWDGNQWDTLGAGLQPLGYGNALKVINNELYVCGSFDSCAGVPANGIAKFDGTKWSSVHSFPALHISAIADVTEYNGDLYVGGNFYDSINGSVSRITRWDGSQWVGLAGGVKAINDPVCNVAKMVVYKGLLYVAGSFERAGSNPFVKGIATWDGTKWENVGGGIGKVPNLTVYDMKVHNDKLYVIGYFEDAGGIGIHHVAVWDGTNWCGFGVTNNTFDNSLFTLDFYHDTMYIGGGFWSVDGDSIPSIAKYIGSGPVNCGNRTGIGVLDKELTSIKIYPNPSQNQVTITANGLSGPYQLQMLNMLGDAVLERNGTFNGSIHVQHALPAGVYLVKLQVGEERFTRKLVVERD